MNLPLVVDQPKEKDNRNLSQEIFEHSSMLKGIRNAINELEKSFEVLDTHYRQYHTKLVSQINDLTNKLNLLEYAANEISKKKVHGEQKELSKQQRQKRLSKLKKNVRKSLVNVYRRACNLSHPDKIKRKNFSDEEIAQLLNLFNEVQKAYCNQDLITLRFVLDKIVSVYGQHNVKPVENEMNLKDELDEVIRSLQKADNELRALCDSVLYSVLQLHLKKNIQGASNLYRSLLINRISTLKAAINSYHAN